MAKPRFESRRRVVRVPGFNATVELGINITPSDPFQAVTRNGELDFIAKHKTNGNIIRVTIVDIEKTFKTRVEYQAISLADGKSYSKLKDVLDNKVDWHKTYIANEKMSAMQEAIAETIAELPNWTFNKI